MRQRSAIFEDEERYDGEGELVPSFLRSYMLPATCGVPNWKADDASGFLIVIPVMHNVSGYHVHSPCDFSKDLNNLVIELYVMITFQGLIYS